MSFYLAPHPPPPPLRLHRYLMHSPSLVHRYLRLTAGTHRKPSSIVRRPFKEESQRGRRWGGGELNYGRRFIFIFLVTSGLVSVRITFPPVSTQSADFRRRFIFVFRCCFNKSSLFFFFQKSKHLQNLQGRFNKCSNNLKNVQQSVSCREDFPRGCVCQKNSSFEKQQRIQLMYFLIQL